MTMSGDEERAARDKEAPDAGADANAPERGEDLAPGGESYPLEVPADDAPLGDDPVDERPPCAECGAPRRVPGPVCVRCGWDESTGAVEGLHVVAGPDDATNRAPTPEIGAEDGSVAADAGDIAADSAETAPAPEGEDAWDPEPIARPWPGGEALVWGLAAAIVAVILVAGMTTEAMFRPAWVSTADKPLGLGTRIGWTARSVVLVGVWAVAVAGAMGGHALIRDRPFGRAATLLSRGFLVAAVMRTASLLPIPNELAAWLVEGLLALALLVAGMLACLRTDIRTAITLSGAAAVGVGTIGIAASLLAWAVLG